MTPDKSKKPLPSSTSIVFLENPQTPYEWRYTLKVVKVEHQKGQWRQCLQRCDGLLSAEIPPLPLYVACLHFYAAVSEEAIARQMHDMSLAKIQAFQHARLRFQQAVSTLPIPDKPHKENEYWSAESGSDVDDTVSLEDSISSVGGSNSCSVTSSPSSKTFEQGSPTSPFLRPSSLQVCKSEKSKNSFNERKAFFEGRLQVSKSSPSPSPGPRSPLFNKPLPTTPPLKLHPCNVSHPTSTTDHPPSSNSTCILSNSQHRYNSQLCDFGAMLAKHAIFLDEAIAKTREAQATGRRRLIKERRICGNEDEKYVDLRTRVANLKKRGWVRDRFIPTKYQELCANALAEL